ncbi:MAG: four helix bundle protein [Verrucomicrobiota bacterium]
MKKGKQRTSNAEYRTLNAASDEPYALRETPGRKYDLEERLLVFASAVIDLSEKLPATRAGNHVAGQILRSGTSPFPNHGEAESAESREDFYSQTKICLKELRETRRWARLVHQKVWAPNDSPLPFVLSESDELIRIFMSSVKTTQQNALHQKHKDSVRVTYSSGKPG